MFDLNVHTQEIVLLIIATAVCALAFLHIVDAKDFIILATMVFAFYFTNSRGNSGQTPSSPDAPK